MFGDQFVKRSPVKLRTFLRAIARNNATTVSISTLALDVDGEERLMYTEEDVTLSRRGAADYLEDLKRIFVIEDIAGWDPGVRSKTRIRMTPKKVLLIPRLQ